MIEPHSVGGSPVTRANSSRSVWASRRRLAGSTRSTKDCTSAGVSMSLLLRGRLHRALVLANLRERLGAGDVGDRAERTVFDVGRSDERRVGTACVRTWRSLWSQSHYETTTMY